MEKKRAEGGNISAACTSTERQQRERRHVQRRLTVQSGVWKGRHESAAVFVKKKNVLVC